MCRPLKHSSEWIRRSSVTFPGAWLFAEAFIFCSAWQTFVFCSAWQSVTDRTSVRIASESYCDLLLLCEPEILPWVPREDFMEPIHRPFEVGRTFVGTHTLVFHISSATRFLGALSALATELCPSKRSIHISQGTVGTTFRYCRDVV